LSRKSSTIIIEVGMDAMPNRSLRLPSTEMCAQPPRRVPTQRSWLSLLPRRL
jgi:hypothetical protein